MFVSQKKLDQALKQRDEAAGVAAQLHTEKQTLLLLLGLALKKLGGQVSFPLDEIENADGQFAMSQAEDGTVTLEIVVKPMAPVVPMKSDAEAERSPVVGEIGPQGRVPAHELELVDSESGV